MHPFAYPALYCLFVWWFSTGLIVFLNNLPPKTFRYSLGAFSVIAGVSLYRLASGSHDTSVAGAYAAFTYGVLVWGWHEMAFFMGFLTGPRKAACRAGCQGAAHFGHGVQACIDHELAILGTGIAVLWATWGAPNQVGCYTFMALWGMRQSAKLNVFLGVLNLGEAFLPPHLTYLFSFMSRRRMNWLMPVSLGRRHADHLLAGAESLRCWDNRFPGGWFEHADHHVVACGAGTCAAGAAAAVHRALGRLAASRPAHTRAHHGRVIRSYQGRSR